MSTCKNCGGGEGVHHFKTKQCPVGGREAPKKQEYMMSTYEKQAEYKTETDDAMETRCIDCGVEYETLGLDISLPDQQWKVVCPENGILCANCICKRAAKFGGAVILAWVDVIDYSLAPGHFNYKEKQ